MNTLFITMFGLATLLIISAIYFIVTAAGMWKVFEKAGRTPWHSLIPFLNIYQEYDICWDSKFAVIIILATVISYFLPQGEDVSTIVRICSYVLSVVVLFIRAIASQKLAQSFGKGLGFSLGLFFFKPIFALILGFGDAKYVGKQN